MTVQASMVRELLGKLISMITAEIDKEKATEGNPDIRYGMDKAMEIIRRFEER